MQQFTILPAAAFVGLLLGVAEGRLVLKSKADDCGKGFDNLNSGSQDYFKTLKKTLWTHPYHQDDFGTFEQELECWFAYMLTTKCGDLPSQADSRKKALTGMCQDVKVGAPEIYGKFTGKEVEWYRNTFPIDEEDSFKADFRQATATAYKLNKKEMLCMTLFTIDDKCVDSKFVRTRT